MVEYSKNTTNLVDPLVPYVPIEPDMFDRPRSGDPSAIKKARDAAKKGGVPTKECARAAVARRWKW
jgi:hypothetical protein